MSHPYKKAMQRIEAPSSLILETAEKMRSPHRRRLPAYARPLAACLLFAVIVFFVIRPVPRSDFIVTPLTPGMFVSEVELRDGHLYFETSGSLPLPDLSFGIGENVKQPWDIPRYLSWLGTDPRPASLPDGFAVAREEAAVTYSGEQENANIQADELYLCYQRASDGALLEIYISKGRLPAHALSDTEENSVLRGVSLFLSFRPADGLWRGQFINDGVGYAVLGHGVTQEEYIRFINSLL
jgi:hypothetical protein